MLVEFIKFSKIDEPDNLKKPIAESFRRKGSIDSNGSEESHGSFSSYEPTSISLDSINDVSTLSSNPPISTKFKQLWKLHWKKSIILLPLVTALPSFFMVYQLQQVMGWRYVHCKALYLIHKFMKDLTC
jgi:hypothetical protein